MKRTIQVTQDHINRGVPVKACDCPVKACDCPVALAIKEVTGAPTVSVAGNTGTLVYGPAHDLNTECLFFPDSVALFVRNFDNPLISAHVQPFDFELELPDDL